MAREMGDVLPGDVNGDQQVNVVDLQVLVARALHPEGLGVNAGGQPNILDIQQAVAQAERPPLPGKAREKAICKVCFFRHQNERAVEPIEDACEPDSMEVPLPVHPRCEYPVRRVVPQKTERYLLRLAPNAPPVLV